MLWSYSFPFSSSSQIASCWDQIWGPKSKSAHQGSPRTHHRLEHESRPRDSPWSAEHWYTASVSVFSSPEISHLQVHFAFAGLTVGVGGGEYIRPCVYTCVNGEAQDVECGGPRWMSDFFIWLARLAWGSLVSAAHVLNSIWATTPTRPFPWVLGVQTLTLVLIQQVFYLPNSLPKPPLRVFQKPRWWPPFCLAECLQFIHNDCRYNTAWYLDAKIQLCEAHRISIR